MRPSSTPPTRPPAAMVLVLSIGLAACHAEGDLFFLERKGAVMPISVRGNVDSGTFILFLHGGPGASAQGYKLAPVMEEMEARYACVYWDQRGSGSSQGSPAPETFSVDEVVADTDAVVKLLRHRYPVKHLFLVGWSWGGFLGTAYLVDPAHQASVTGYVMVDGSFDVVHGVAMSVQFVIEHAEAQVAAGVDVELWQAALDWARATPLEHLDQENLMRLHDYVAAAHGYVWNEQAVGEQSLVDELRDPADLYAMLNNGAQALGPGGYELTGLNLTPQMSSIVVPTLITWGRHDGILPVALAQQAYDALGTHPSSKSVVILENSAHGGLFEESDRWLQVATAFIDAQVAP